MIKKIFVVLFFVSFAVVFSQSEERLELVEIIFDGNEAFGDDELSAVIASQETPWWFWKTLNSIVPSLGREPAYFDSLNTPLDIKSLKIFYKENGFFESQVTSSYEVDTADYEATLTFHIEEGPPFLIDDYKITGVDSIPSGLRYVVFTDTKVDSAVKFTTTLIEEDQDRILQYLRDRGWMLARIEQPTQENPNVWIDTASNSVDVFTRINTGERYKISEVRVTKSGPGEDLVTDTLIKKLVNVKPGDTYSQDKIKRGQARLIRTNLFNSAIVSEAISDTSGNIAPLSVNTNVGLLNEISPEVILNNQESALNAGLGISYSRKNFFGEARTFKLATSFVMQDIYNIDYSNLINNLSINDTTLLGYLDLRASIDQPYLFNQLIDGRLEGYITLNKRREYNSTTQGMKLSLDFELPSYTFFNSLITYYNFEVSDYLYDEDFIIDSYLEYYKAQGVEIDASLVQNIEDAFKIESNREFSDISSFLGLEANAAQTNDPLAPTRGFSLYLLAEEGNLIPYLFNQLGAQTTDVSQFYKVLTNISTYFDVYNSEVSTLALKFRTGYMQTYMGFDTDIPINRRFYAGGSNSVRGWRARELTPVTIDGFSATAPTNQELLTVRESALDVGGTFLLEGSIETRNRIIGNVGAALFLDYGNTFNGYGNFRWDELAVAVGFGFRYYSPVGPIRLDFGFKAYDPYNEKVIFNARPFRTMEFHLGIGEAF